jgi:hypothetical protein
MTSMCLRHFTHPVTGRTGWYCGVDIPDPLEDNIDIECTAEEIPALIAEHQPDVIDIREHPGTPSPDIEAVIAAASLRKRLRSCVRSTDARVTITTQEG